MLRQARPACDCATSSFGLAQIDSRSRSDRVASDRQFTRVGSSFEENDDIETFIALDIAVTFLLLADILLPSIYILVLVGGFPCKEPGYSGL